MNQFATLALISTTFVSAGCGSSTEAAANPPTTGTPATVKGSIGPTLDRLQALLK